MGKTKGNKSAKNELNRIYGKQCMFSRARIALRIEEMGGIRTYKSFLKEIKLKRKKISHEITFHHLKHRSEGGETSPENGANIEEIVHQYIHSLPREQEEVINNMLREWKINYLAINGDECGSIKLEEQLEFDTIELQKFEDLPRHIQNEIKYKNKLNKEEKLKRLSNPTRAMRKKELEEEIDEYYEEK